MSPVRAFLARGRLSYLACLVVLPTDFLPDLSGILAARTRLRCCDGKGEKACRGVGLDGDGASDSVVRVDRNWLRRIVRTSTVEGKERRRGRYAGYRPDWKKAYVRLKEGEKMPEYINSL